MLRGVKTRSACAARSASRPNDAPLPADVVQTAYHDFRVVEVARGLANYSSTEARLIARKPSAQIEQLLGTGVYLDLHVRVAKDWQRDPRQLRKLGF